MSCSAQEMLCNDDDEDSWTDKLGKNRPIVQKTLLGWVISDEIIFFGSSEINNNRLYNFVSNDEKS